MNRILLGQRLAFGFEGTCIPENFAALVREYKIGNVILFRRNIENNEQLRRLCRELQSLIIAETGHPAFITIDQEGGMVTRLAPDAVNVPGNMAIAVHPAYWVGAGLLALLCVRQLFDRRPERHSAAGVALYGVIAVLIGIFVAEQVL